MDAITALSKSYKIRPITTSELGVVQYSENITIDALLDTGVNWNFLIPERNTLYYTFDTHNGTSASAPAPLTAFNVMQMNAARAVLDYAAKITGIHFVETLNGNAADFHFAACDLPGNGVTGLCQSTYFYAYNNRNIVSHYQAEAYVYLDNSEFAPENNSPSKASAGYEALLHEVGHGLGLKHPFEAPYSLPANQDNSNNTIMSYSAVGAHKAMFQAYDLAALKWIYGGDGLGKAGHYMMNAPFMDQGLSFNGTAKADRITGTKSNDVLSGLAGNDTLIGGGGRDVLVGGLGKDTYNLAEVAAVTDTVRIAVGDSRMNSFDKVNSFKLGMNSKSVVGVDKLDLIDTRIAGDVLQSDGKNVGQIHSHHIINGLISFDDVDHYENSMVINKADFPAVLNYLKANVVRVGDTVVFNAENSTYVFQDQGANDTLVQLAGDTASGLSATGLVTGAIWLV